MSICTICKQPSRRIKNMMICANGHTVHVIEEEDDDAYGEDIVYRTATKKIKTRRLQELREASVEEVEIYRFLKYLIKCIKVFGIPMPQFKKYLPLVYGTVESWSALKKGPKTLGEILLYIIKRDIEEEKGEAYLITDFRRQLGCEPGLTFYYDKITSELEKSEVLRARSYNSYFNKHISPRQILKLLKTVFPDSKGFDHGVYGDLSTSMLEKMCCMMGTTKTPKMERAFKRFKESLACIQLKEKSTLMFAEHVVGAFLFLYFSIVCKFDVSSSHVKIVEKPDKNDASVTEQSFYLREGIFKTFKHACQYHTEIERSRGTGWPKFDMIALSLKSILIGKKRPNKYLMGQSILETLLHESGIGTAAFREMVRKIIYKYDRVKRRV